MENPKNEDNHKTEWKKEDISLKQDKKSVKEKFKAKWNQQDETCSSCGQVTRISKGLTKQNVKRLIGLKIKASDLLVLFMLIMMLFIAWAYYRDMQVSRDFMNNIDYNCMIWEKSHITNLSSYANPNDLILKEANETNETELNNSVNDLMINVTNVSTNQT